MLRSVTICGAVLVIGLSAASTAIAQPEQSAAATPCVSIETASASNQALEACGDTVYPLIGSTALPNNAREYVYGDAAGQDIRATAPPEGFDPGAASTAELEEYGFHIPSASAPGYAEYEAAIKQSVGVQQPPPRLIAAPASSEALVEEGSEPSSDVEPEEKWSGVVDDKGEGSYTLSEATWKEPVDGNTECSKNAVSIWTGIGEQNLAQDGSEQGVTGMGSNELWYETTNEAETEGTNKMVGIGMKVSPEASAIARTEYVGGGNEWAFHMYSASEGKWSMFYRGTIASGRNYAEDIVERPAYTEDGVKGLYHIRNYNYVKMTGYVDELGIGEHSHFRFWMYEGVPTESSLLAEAENVYESHSFKDTYVRCKAA